MKTSHTIIIALSLILLSSCSSMSKGTGAGGLGADGMGPNGGTLTDEDLALSTPQYGDGQIPQAAEGGVFGDIYFDYDSSTISRQYQEQLQTNAEIMGQDPSLKVEVEGHTDSRGTNEYNLALGEARAKAVAALLVNYGANPKQITTVSYGEEIPIDGAENEAAYAKNRRAHFALFRGN